MGNSIFPEVGGSGGTPGGTNTQVQYNDAGAFGGNAGMVFDESVGGFRVGNAITDLTAGAQAYLNGITTIDAIRLNLTPTSADDSGAVRGVVQYTQAFTGNTPFTPAGIYGVGFASPAMGVTLDGGIRGGDFDCIVNGAGTVTKASPVVLYLQNDGGGTVTDGYLTYEFFYADNTSAMTRFNGHFTDGYIGAGSEPAAGAVYKISGFIAGTAIDLINYNSGVFQVTSDGNTVTKSVRGTAVAFASVPAVPVEGMLVAVNNSTTAVWGATITGGGANHVLAYYNGTNWTVAGK